MRDLPFEVIEVPCHSLLLAFHFLLEVLEVILLLSQQKQHLLAVQLLLPYHATYSAVIGDPGSSYVHALLRQISFAVHAVLLLAFWGLGGEVVGI